MRRCRGKSLSRPGFPGRHLLLWRHLCRQAGLLLLLAAAVLHLFHLFGLATNRWGLQQLWQICCQPLQQLPPAGPVGGGIAALGSEGES